jgi:hypothetical protein
VTAAANGQLKTMVPREVDRVDNIRSSQATRD